MVYQKGKPRPPMKVTICAICRKSFQPSSGAQRRVRVQGQVAHAEVPGKEGEEGRPHDRKGERCPCQEEQLRRSRPRAGSLSPLAAYIKGMIDQALKERELADFVREVVREEISSRLKPLFGMG